MGVLALRSSQFQFIQIQLHLDDILLNMTLGQYAYRLDVVFVEQHLATIFSVIIYAEFKSDSLQDASIFLSFRKQVNPFNKCISGP